jgi:hypothetical protein
MKNIMKIVEIKAVDCAQCRISEGLWDRLKELYPDCEFIQYTKGIDAEADVISTQYNIMQAPCFIVNDGEKIFSAITPLKTYLKEVHDNV